MDVPLPTSRGQLPKEKKDSETEDVDHAAPLPDDATDIDDTADGVVHTSYSYTHSSRVIWHEIWDNTTPLTWLCFVAALVVVVGVAVLKGFSFFFVHALFMTMGYVGFASESMLVYRPFASLNVRSPNQRIQRNIHKLMNHGTGACTLLGLAGILIHRGMRGKSLVPHGLHSWTGALVIMLVLVQIGVGQKKLRLLQFQGERSFRWHGRLGQLTYALGIVAVGLGLVHIYKDATVVAWIAVILCAVLPVVYAYSCVTKHAGYAVVDQL
ncbi:Aste57867_8909 [Aphanomyces stellatus]|uniref:Aste57867_8909 protein n=1 Tax=Aphanomyces stellatus TaxID=120398 RepID=A0A485KLJ1_9STRA|nr:hypothetical protein As57867_008874 [Aphanomyces stellatus]VFT85793.1 Aste57867_8909 [Aphanomyces stellatus]